MNTEYTSDQVVQLYLDDIIPNRFQPREVFDEKALKELAVSIKEHGVIQPIIVRNVKGKYEIIAGERRYKASALAGLTKIPAIIRELDDKESSKVALLENLQRKNLTPIEEARTYQKILEIDQMTQEELAKTMGKSQSAVANKLRLLSLPDEVQDSLLKEQISERHARALLNIPDSSKQTEMLKKIINNKLSVRAVEEEIKTLYPKEDELNEGIVNMNESNNTMTTNISSPSARNFINNEPLVPTDSIPEVNPSIPKFSNQQTSTFSSTKALHESKFINYGEIDDEDDEDTEPPMQFINTSVPVDLNSIRENAMDINISKQEQTSPTADLDSLLNLQNMSMGPAVGHIPGTNPYLNSAEEIVKTDNKKIPKQVKSADYFKSADFIPNIPTRTMGIPEISSINYSIDGAMKKIRDIVTDFKNHGISIESDEMNFENSYQIIIKIDK